MSRRLAQDSPSLPDDDQRPAQRAVVAVGANLGDRADTVARAVAELDGLPLTRLVRAAEPLETVALTLDGPDAEAPAYLNTVALVDTRLAPSVLLAYLHAIEQRHGRAPRTADQPRWQDRTLDLDLIVHGDAVIDTPTLVLPHPRAAERDFVLGPWLAVDPDAAIPGRGRVDALLAALSDAHASGAGPGAPGGAP
ncbi:2-amino-4-hydroxy-6-hydroxymethyldihydropteridine diphosphokinase [Microbacterium sp. cf332]|uniref:2-amino-4-hydroxy-6- hydroxymethyldihydropteridine diphosphokinase n=1 Tax=Microbacterium sp. cf332 TaxID=1761804 RepID=UPI000889BBDA|nr:2-amino-4-hydroxy-6-hydroxymethyldihydropteridine diphosphokinase [Microbacterium sp. cf332]SDQ63638.1 2-amino-4-hydroxy-6-hydroxymethyldihydropteridinediphosphokinase [Microbacterium sp. cf332]